MRAQECGFIEISRDQPAPRHPVPVLREVPDQQIDPELGQLSTSQLSGLTLNSANHSETNDTDTMNCDLDLHLVSLLTGSETNITSRHNVSFSDHKIGIDA